MVNEMTKPPTERLLKEYAIETEKKDSNKSTGTKNAEEVEETFRQ